MGRGRRLTTETVERAEALADLRLTREERRGVAALYGRHRAGFRAVRAAGLAFDEAPASCFRPRPPGWSPSRDRAVRWSAPRPGAPPSDQRDLAFAPVTRLSAWLRSGRVTSLQLTRLALDRLRALDPRLHCVVTLLEEPALREARRADREIAAGRWRGPLHGVPWGAKDLLDAAGGPTTWGAEPYRERPPEGDATVVRRLREAGAVLVAKLSVGALAMGDAWFGGRTRNPWNPRQGSSGSSAGSAAAVAAGLVPFALGTETMGSILSPCMRCGTTGLRPTFGRVPRTGCMPLAWSMDKIGPITRSVEDAALVFDAIQGSDGIDADAVDAPFQFDGRRRPSGLTVGHVAGDFRGPRSRPSDRAALRGLRELGADVRPVRMPELPTRPLWTILVVEAAAAFDDLTRSGRDDLLTRQGRMDWPNMFRTARFVPAVELVQAQRLRGRMARELGRVFDEVDVVVAPGRWTWLHAATNGTGHPALTLRAGVRQGRPANVTLFGRLDEEGRLLELGRALEGRLRASHARPPAS